MRFWLIIMTTCESITLIKWVCENSHTINLMLVLAGNILIEDWFICKSLEDNYLIGTLDTGYSINQLSVE